MNSQSAPSKHPGIKGLRLEAPPGPTYKRPLGFLQNRGVRKEIESLDATKDCQRIVYLMVAYEFSHEIVNALDVIYFNSAADKSVADLLGRSSEMGENGMKRYDDSRFMIWKFLECGWDSDAGYRSIQHMNKIHAHYSIDNEQFQKSLAIFMVAPATWIEMFGWRKMTEHEKTAWHAFWYNIGEQMEIDNPPASLDEAKAIAEAALMKSTEVSKHSKKLSEVNFAVYREKAPALLKPFTRIYLRTFFKPNIEKAFNLPPLPMPVRALVALSVKLNAVRRRFFCRRTYPFLLSTQSLMTYPGAKPPVEHAGPAKVIKSMQKKQAAAQQESVSA